MKISTRGRYGLRALTDLAANAECEVMSLARTAQRQNLSLNYLEQVFGMLRRAGIVESVKGSGGGYRLAADMDEITVKQILEILEGSFSIAGNDERKDPDAVQKAIRNLVWDAVDRRMDQYLEGKTLGSLVREYRAGCQRTEKSLEMNGKEEKINENL